ncbi:MAG: alpha/beta fold hydrolase [Acidimicrobiia bacterium]
MTGAQFAPLGSGALQIHAADLPGHGETLLYPVDVPTTVEAIARLLTSFRRPVPLLGYSQGGRVALLTALDYPDLVERLVLISTSPGLAKEEAREERRARDETRAAHIEAVGVEAFLDEWLDGSIAGTRHLDDEARRRDRAVREVNTETGLAAALRGLGQGAQPYVGDRLGDLEMPLLTVSGSADAAYTGLAREMAEAAPYGNHVSIDGAGHNVILDAPQALVSALTDFALD